MATSADYRATAQQLLIQARAARENRRPREESDDLRDEAATHSRLAIAAALEALAAAPAAAKTA
jgi:hypothetical protein